MAETPALEKIYWFGNSAKMRLVREILARTQGKAATIFDYGAGRGGDWPEILSDNPNLSLVAYEPYAPSREALQKKLVGKPRARIIDEAGLAGAAIEADYIVSFSVFEHVYDRMAYLKNARRHLKNGGTFFLNYDDGHFRQQLHLDLPRRWPASLFEHGRNLLAPLWPKLGREHLYQRRVMKDEVAAEVAAAAFLIVQDTYDNLSNFKDLAKTIPPEQRDAFSALWLEVEERLNSEFRSKTTEIRGDTTNLWQSFLSRTLELTTN